MKRCLIGWVAAGVMLWTFQAFAATELILTDAGYQVMTVGPNGAELTPVVRVDAVRDYRTGAPPTPGPGPTPNPPPPGQLTRADKVKALSEVVRDADGAMGWATVARTMKDSVGTSAIPEDHWKRITNVALSGVALTNKPRWETWLGAINALAEGKYDKAFFQDVETGLVKAYNLEKSTIDAMVAAAKGEANAEQQAAIPETFAWIIQLITFILEMLKQFGIIGLIGII